MANAIDLSGKTYGRLTVLSRNPIKGNRRQVRWNCVCECGNDHIVTGESLRGGKSKSCGCLLFESRYVKNKNTDRQKAMLSLIYHSLKKRHIKKFDDENYISFGVFKKISLSNCFYCNSEPMNSQRDIRYGARKKSRGIVLVTDFVLKYNGVDRIDSTKGYTRNNVLPCCKNCNSAKMTLSINDFKELIINIYKNWASK